jgi:predicted flap endonuclease-1-like 5' DNA nuclease
LLAVRNRRLVALEDAADRLAAATARVEELSGHLAALRQARHTELAARDARIAELETALVEARRAADDRARPTDDLKRIRGIGPVIEGLLHGMGITTFRQVAALSGEELGRLGDLLGVFRNRIDREGWIAQAAELARGTGRRAEGG